MDSAYSQGYFSYFIEKYRSALLYNKINLTWAVHACKAIHHIEKMQIKDYINSIACTNIVFNLRFFLFYSII